MNFEHEVDLKTYIQGGPNSSIVDMGKKVLKGQIVLPVRVDRDGALEMATRRLLSAAHDPSASITLDTNHILSYSRIAADNGQGGDSDNELLSLDCMVIEELSLTAAPDTGVKLTVSFTGMVDARAPADLVAPPSSFLLGRTLSFQDCDCSRLASAMRNVVSFNVTVRNKIIAPAFIPPCDVDNRATSWSGTSPNQPADWAFMPEQPLILGIEEVRWGGDFQEVLRKGGDTETHMHAGWIQDEDLTFTFGPARAVFKVPLYKVSRVPLVAGILNRKTEFMGVVKPSRLNSPTSLFFFS
ncbi:MAG: hypothetical protein JSS66_04765 [Armatimonadetes bacterium]|nr:hypothetical protein [Armatimonadota bacterium]